MRLYGRYLGEGTARQRTAIVTGLSESVDCFVTALNSPEYEISSDDTIRLQMMMQHMDYQTEMTMVPGDKPDLMYLSTDLRAVDRIR